MVLLRKTCFLRSAASLGSSRARISTEATHGHVIHITHVVFVASVVVHVAAKHVHILLVSLLCFVHSNVLTGHKVIVDFHTFLGQQLDVGPLPRVDL